MRDKIIIELGVVDTSNLEEFLANTMEKINIRATERGHFNTTENRFMNLGAKILAQTQVTDEEWEYADFINEADDNSHKNTN